METTNFVMFAFNYPHDFIKKAWAGNSRMIEHLIPKFLHYYSSVGSAGVMVKFYAELDEANREILTKYIKAYYSK